MFFLLLSLLLSQPPDAAPRVDEGNRWQTATLVKTFDRNGPQEARLIFWRDDAFGESQPAGNVEWAAVISWHDEGDGFRFLWYDESDRCYRQLKAPEWFRVDVNLETCRFEWPRCRHSDSRREVSRRISHLRIMIGADYWKMQQDNERRDAENARCRKR